MIYRDEINQIKSKAITHCKRRRWMVKFVDRVRREMITVVWPQEKETKKRIGIKS
jgi:preprotein translocase subunit SecE